MRVRKCFCGANRNVISESFFCFVIFFNESRAFFNSVLGFLWIILFILVPKKKRNNNIIRLRKQIKINIKR